ncbi:MAG: AMP-dependent synthetase [Gammaproteobacteria bacterium]|nr:AMP-dependent synthetase [Gammaproteobacteria bacterium]
MLTESYWPATNELPLFNRSCGEALRIAAHAVPTRIALVDGQVDPTLRRRWTYAELLTQSERTARALLTHFKPGEHIAVWSGNSPEWVILQFGLALAGMVMVTVNPAFRVAELAYVLRQSRASGIFHQAEYRGRALGAVIEEAVAADKLDLQRVVCIDDLARFIEGRNDLALPVVEPSAPAMIQYTSGTTGQPKGALLNHYSVTNNARLMALLKGADADTVNLAVAPLFHTAGCVGAILGSIQTYGAIVLPPAFDAESMLDFIEQERVSFTFAVPTMLIALLDAQAQRPRDLSTLKVVFSGATIVPVEVVRRVEAEFGVRLVIGFGQTESSPGITHTRLDDGPRDKSETIGRPMPQVEVKIIDPTTGATLAIDHPGELCTRGFLVMMGYYDMPEATAAAIDQDGWLHTGDLCAMDARGYCRVTGRLKDMIIRGGENIYPREIEEVLYTHAAIAEVAVFGAPNQYWGEEVGAAFTLKAGATVTSETLREFVSTRLARHKLPTLWFCVSEIPATASGKLQKFRLVERYRAGELASSAI